MKKGAVILLLLIYSMSTFGVSLKEFYCCGKLKSVSIVIADIEKDKCNKAAKEEGCCKTKYQYFKIKDTHFSTVYLTAPLKYYTDLHPLTFSPQLISFNSPATDVINRGNAPPLLHPGVRVYISNCVFRI